MIAFYESNDKLIIKRNNYFLGGVLIAGIMALGGIVVIFGILPFEEVQTFIDIFALVFLLIWESGVIYGFVYYIREYSRYTVISRDGVSCYTCFKKEFLKWDDVKDWGLSYCGQTRGEGNTYCLYFSEHECQIKNDCRKKLKGKMIKIFVFEDDYSEAVCKIIPFCNENTDIMPFVGKDKYHFI